MDVLFLISVFRLYPGFKRTFEHNSVRKNLFLSACFCWDSGLSSRGMDQKFRFGGLICYGNFLSGLCISLRQSIQTACKITRRCWSSSISYWQRTWLLQHEWTRTTIMFAWSRDWTTLLPLRKNLSFLHFHVS